MTIRLVEKISGLNLSTVLGAPDISRKPIIIRAMHTAIIIRFTFPKIGVKVSFFSSVISSIINLISP